MTNFGPKTKKEQLREDWHLYLRQTREADAALGAELKNVVDLFDTVRTGLELDLGREPTETTILEVTRIILKRWDTIQEHRRQDERAERRRQRIIRINRDN